MSYLALNVIFRISLNERATGKSVIGKANDC